MTKLIATKNDLPSNAKTAVIEMLNARIADTIDLALATKQAHWNLKGMNFIAVHELLDTLRGEIDTYVDDMAERAVQLGGVALGTAQVVEAESNLEPYPVDIHTTKEHLQAMIERLAQVGNAIRGNIDDADEAGDAGTADLFTGISRGLDKSLWFLEAHLGA